MLAPVALFGCGSKSPTAQPPVTLPAATTTSTTLPLVSKITAVGVRSGVSQPPFYPQVMVTAVSCGAFPKGGRFVRISLPAGGAGTPIKTVMTKPTAVIVAPGGAILIDPRYATRALYAESMPSITTAKQGAFVLTMQNSSKAGGDGLTVVAGAVQVNGDYACPAVDVAYPGT